ncbi:MAG: hypothetical protein M3468_13485 [Acidobacteriota bacterium]|nr:hypothetical protein [Acidobacteriota bacterium]
MNAPPTRSRSWHLTLAALLVGVVTVAALLPSTNVRWSADDAYVLEHLQSADLRSRLFAFNLDRPSDSSGAWWEGIVYQRRFVRIVPSALMSLEVRLLGQDPWRLHLVSLALHLLNTLLIFHLSRRWLGHAGKAALVGMVFGAHPVVVEVVSWFACQPLLIATAFTLLATECWVRYRVTGKAVWLTAAVVTLLAAVTSYEASIAAPVLLVLADVVLHRGVQRGPRGWIPRLALLSVLVPFAVLSAWNSAGVSTPETSHRPGMMAVWNVARIDLEAYLFKALGLVPPETPGAYWIHNALAEPASAALLMVVLLPLFWWARRQPLALLGMLTFIAFLAPPWLVRATVSVLNQPTLRQLYLPLMGLAAVLTALLSGVRFRTAVVLALPLIVAITLFDRQPRRGPGSGGADAARVPTERALANTDLALPVIVTGSFDPVLERAGCNYDVSLTWPGRQQLNLVPPSVSGATPRLVRTGERSFLAAADARGFAIASERVATPANRGRYSGGGTRFRAVPPQLLTDGTQQVGEARLEVTERVGALITGIGYTLDKPLEQYAFLAVDGCTKVRAHRPE